MKERLEPRLRISLGAAVAIGPGKAAILEGIAETGSIAPAARRMGTFASLS
jgi:molybdate transport system regulatory protein